MSKVTFFFNDTATTEIYTYGHTLSLHDALPISSLRGAEGDATISSYRPCPKVDSWRLLPPAFAGVTMTKRIRASYRPRVPSGSGRGQSRSGRSGGGASAVRRAGSRGPRRHSHRHQLGRA